MERIIYRHADCYKCYFYNNEKERCSSGHDLNNTCDDDDLFIQDTCILFTPHNYENHYIDAYAIMSKEVDNNVICNKCEYNCKYDDDSYDNCNCNCHGEYVSATTIKKFSDRNKISLIKGVYAKRIIL